jgi:carbamoyltransferase
MTPLVQAGVSQQKIKFIEHHLCHASTAYYGQGNMTDEILVLTCDAAGDGICATVNVGKNGHLERLTSVPLTESVAILYSLLTFLTGFVPLEHEYKLMGLAPYSFGSERSQRICDYLRSHFRFPEDNPLGWERANGVIETFKIGAQLKKYIEYKRFDNIAGGLQLFIEDFFIEWVHRVIKETGVHKLALSGGLFMNVKLNKLIMEIDEVESVYVFPSCGDETNSIGAAWAEYSTFLESSGQPINIPELGAIYLGRQFTSQDSENVIDNFKFKKKVRIKSCEDIEKRCAELLAQDQVVARFKGRMEFGARALGNRSILARPDNWNTVKLINEMIKMRDFWMPFAPSILAESASEILYNPKQVKAPYMIMAFGTRESKLNNVVASVHPYDHSCRPQIVEKEWNPDYYRLIHYYKELTGEGAILNTSFNLHGYPIVYKPREALEVFDNSGLRYLALENIMIEEI